MSRRGIEFEDEDWRWIKTVAAARGLTIAAFLNLLVAQERERLQTARIVSEVDLVPLKGKES